LTRVAPGVVDRRGLRRRQDVGHAKAGRHVGRGRIGRQHQARADGDLGPVPVGGDVDRLQRDGVFVELRALQPDDVEIDRERPGWRAQ
jgi:hypothetical protein